MIHLFDEQRPPACKARSYHSCPKFTVRQAFPGICGIPQTPAHQSCWRPANAWHDAFALKSAAL